MTKRGIFFDAADVLYYRTRPTDDYVAGLLQQRGLPAELPAEQRARLKAMRSQAKAGQLTADEYWDEVLRLHGVTGAQERRELSAMIDAYSDQILAMPGVRDMLSGLKARGFVLGIVTDTVYPLPRKMRWLEQIGAAEFVDVIACSTVLGVHKPHPAMYLDAVRQAGLTPAESVFVGHDARELEGARRAGLATVAINYEPQAKADFYAESLPALLQVPILKTARAGVGVTMSHEIEAIFIDVGNTLRILVKDEPYQARARERIAALVGAQGSPDAFCDMLDARYKVYRKWAFETLTEAPERELWTRWMLPECSPQEIGPLAGELTYLYRQTMGHRHAVPDAQQVAVELTRRGYKLGIISNTITEREIPEWLEEDGLSQYFTTVVLSSLFGRRKPGIEIYLEAARRAGVAPAQAAYVADNPSRDVPGCRRAGFGMVIMMIDPAVLPDKDLTGEYEPDMVIHTLSELLNIFPERA